VQAHWLTLIPNRKTWRMWGMEIRIGVGNDGGLARSFRNRNYFQPHEIRRVSCGCKHVVNNGSCLTMKNHLLFVLASRSQPNAFLRQEDFQLMPPVLLHRVIPIHRRPPSFLGCQRILKWYCGQNPCSNHGHVSLYKYVEFPCDLQPSI
jgi:hypothetical protein